MAVNDIQIISMMRIRVIAILFILGGFSLSAQNFDEYRKQMMKDFSDFRSEKQSEIDTYRKDVNADFARFMRQAWKKYNGEPAVSEPRDIPDVPPVVLPDLGEPEMFDNEVPYVDVIPLEFEDVPPVPLLPLPEKHEDDHKGPHVNLRFYGTECIFRFDLESRIWLADASEGSAADMWETMCSGSFDTLLMDCLHVRSEMALCDWAYYKLACSLAESIYGDGNESVMLAAFIMNQSGYRLKIARSDDDAFHLLVGTADGIYGCPYFRVNGCDYYLTDGSEMESLYIFDRDFPNTDAVRLTISQNQKFSQESSDLRSFHSVRFPDAAVQVKINRNLLDFYADYPLPFKHAGIKSSWVFYATAPLSTGFRESLLHPLAVSISGKTQEEAANILLNFVQTAFEYQTDDEQWGYERPFFPEETMYYPYSDCEDRAILYSRLVRELLGLDVVFLYYPGHLATAVRFDEDIMGDYVTIEGDKYVICDPTYINAPVGLQMPGIDVGAIKVVRIED